MYKSFGIEYYDLGGSNMIKNRNEMKREIEIDLSGPEGNAFVLLAYARDLGRKLNMSQEEINFITHRMQRSDYENLIKVFDKSFGHVVTLYRER